MVNRYPRLISKLKILLFSGDVDECVPYNGAEQWTRGFGYEEVTIQVLNTMRCLKYVWHDHFHGTHTVNCAVCDRGVRQAEHWYPWMVDGQVGGYATIYKTPRNFTWATVRGAGHMAPLYQPLRVFDLFHKFLNGQKP